MSLHKLTAGSGYDYLTRQVAVHDSTEKGHLGLASYYAAKGETPGVWVGSGMAGIEGLTAGDMVTAEQMQALFGFGHHPLEEARRAEVEAREGTPEEVREATRLGRPFKVYDNDVSDFRVEVARRLSEHNTEQGLPAGAPVPLEVRARIRSEIAEEYFRAEHGRDPVDPRELAATIAKHSRPRTTAVAGFDLTFSPVKSVSALWAVADPATAARIERAHQSAMHTALRFIEEHALYTRSGANGIQQIDVRGLVATAFTHRDSRDGDPDLHTHVAVANKVQTADGRWLAIDGRVLYKASVTASETYNTALEKTLEADLGLRFEARPHTDARKRPVREIVGVPALLNERWSSRRASIVDRKATLTAQFQRTHGRPPTPVEAIRLAQQATLETREAKKEPRSLAEQRAAWRRQAGEVLGGDKGIAGMLRQTMSPARTTAPTVSARWIGETSAAIVTTIQGQRSTWQTWHVRAEALRRVREMNLPVAEVDPVVERLVRGALESSSVPLDRPDAIIEPPQLTRQDGASVYTVHGSQQYTSDHVLAAERRILAAAGRLDGLAATPEAVDLALLESTANGVTLNAGQTDLVRRMATSGARVQLAIAPAGSGKTTAMRALATAWENHGGTVLGLAPSAAAAAALGSQIDTTTDTLAKLTWGIQTGVLPDWASTIGPQTLLVIDEAGMADTLSLDAAVAFALDRGASVRLIGDDQQLAAIGAGGVLRDIASTHGALRLTELMRFADPAEGAASLALRDGSPEALGYYLDHGRVHVGDLTTMTDDLFTAWRIDRANQRDSIMLAPTRDLVVELNKRAQADRLDGHTPDRTAPLSDGNQASVGDLLITRSNDRRLRMTATDWVKNGDRWTVTAVHPNGSLVVQHAQNQRTLTLPADYVARSTELGYATTVHAAQGVSVDTMHGLATGQESRQQLYTMLTRGRHANHVYLEVVGDGDPHNIIRPDNIAPPTATDILEGVIARDDAPVSATTLLRDAADPRQQLGQAAARYLDAVYVAAEEHLGPERSSRLDLDAQALVPGITEQPAWPTLRAHLTLLAAHGTDPGQALRAAIEAKDLDSALDAAAVLDWRLDDTGMRNSSPGPLPWMPGIPETLTEHSIWGPYLHARSELVADLAESVRSVSDQASPAWVPSGTRVPVDAVQAVEVWRAATGVEATDRRPTGAPQKSKAAAQWQQRLNHQVAGSRTPALREWSHRLREIEPQVGDDPFAATLAERLATLSRAGLPALTLLRQAAARGPLPDDHAAAALWWRMTEHVPAVDDTPDSGLTTSWQPRLAEQLGTDRAETIQHSPAWPRLVTTIEHALHRGTPLAGILDTATATSTAADIDECQAMIWRLTLLAEATDELDPEVLPHDADMPPHDLWDGVAPDEHAPTIDQWINGAPLDEAAPTTGSSPSAPNADAPAAPDLDLAALYRSTMGPLDPSDREVEDQNRRAAEADLDPVPAARLLHVNTLTRAYYETQLPGSWAQDYLRTRFGTDLAGHPDYAPGFAPSGWTRLVDHLRDQGVADGEMLAAGVATRASTGRLIDRFRDRAVFPITHDGEVLGFVGRRHPDLSDDDRSGPKYLNTAQTTLFHKGAQLYGATPGLANGATPVLVEGPMDAIAITLATHGTHVGVAPLGTSLTAEQAHQLAHASGSVLVATDADTAGRVAAERAYWLLAQHTTTTGYVTLPDGSDPADTLAADGPRALARALEQHTPLADVLIAERLANLEGDAAQSAVRVLAAADPHRWHASIQEIAATTGRPVGTVADALAHAATEWNRDPRRAAEAGLADVSTLRKRLDAHVAPSPDRWARLANELDPRLTTQSDWQALRGLLETSAQQGHDVETLARHALAEGPLSDLPTQDLRQRIAYALPGTDHPQTVAPPTTLSGTEHARRATTTVQSQPHVPRR